MIKHVLTTKCNRKCEYCITRNLDQKQIFNIHKIDSLYSMYSKVHDSIMLTGGEPTLAKNFWLHVCLANALFKEVFITSQNPKVINFSMFQDNFEAISFSIHDLNNIPKVEVNIPVYACILDMNYSKALVYKVKDLGYSGLTINEEQRNGETFNQELPIIKDFNIKINRKGKCLNDTIILPNLKVINNFDKYL